MQTLKNQKRGSVFDSRNAIEAELKRTAFCAVLFNYSGKRGFRLRHLPQVKMRPISDSLNL
jgi:hypothetical protein